MVETNEGFVTAVGFSFDPWAIDPSMRGKGGRSEKGSGTFGGQMKDRDT